MPFKANSIQSDEVMFSALTDKISVSMSPSHLLRSIRLADPMGCLLISSRIRSSTSLCHPKMVLSICLRRSSLVRRDLVDCAGSL